MNITHKSRERLDRLELRITRLEERLKHIEESLMENIVRVFEYRDNLSDMSIELSRSFSNPEIQRRKEDDDT